MTLFPLPAQRQLPLPLLLKLPLFLKWVPVLWSHVPDFGAGDVGTLRCAKGSIFGVAFSWLLLLAKQKK